MELPVTKNLDGFIFNFNPTIIRNLRLAQSTHKHLNIPKIVQNQVVDYLLNSEYLSFCSYYYNQAVIKTYIFKDGQILQQICQDYLISSNLLIEISQLHYWLMQELLLVTNISTTNNFKFLLLFLIFMIILGLLLAYVFIYL